MFSLADADETETGNELSLNLCLSIKACLWMAVACFISIVDDDDGGETRRQDVTEAGYVGRSGEINTHI